ncbi:MAG: hypothetical protein ACJA1L_002378, partial [Paracoccaceae bacterium]
GMAHHGGDRAPIFPEIYEQSAMMLVRIKVRHAF